MTNVPSWLMAVPADLFDCWFMRLPICDQDNEHNEIQNPLLEEQ